MIVVSDTSPVSSLMQIGHCELLRDLFEVVCIPGAVRDELAKFHPALPTFLDVRDIVDRGRAQSLLSSLDLGEAEAIVLAIEIRADYLLVDERLGRAIATQSGLKVIGLVGVLLLAKQRGLIGSLSRRASDSSRLSSV